MELIKKPTKAISEQEFNLEIKEDGKTYNIRGFIDKLFLYDRGKKALIRDFKTSKQLFKGKNNRQLTKFNVLLSCQKNFS